MCHYSKVFDKGSADKTVIISHTVEIDWAFLLGALSLYPKRSDLCRMAPLSTSSDCVFKLKFYLI